MERSIRLREFMVEASCVMGRDGDSDRVVWYGCNFVQRR